MPWHDDLLDGNKTDIKEQLDAMIAEVFEDEKLRSNVSTLVGIWADSLCECKRVSSLSLSN